MKTLLTLRKTLFFENSVFYHLNTKSDCRKQKQSIFEFQIGKNMDKLHAKVEEMLYHNEDNFKIAKLLKNDLKTYLLGLEEIFAESGGKDFLVKHTCKIDHLLMLVYKISIRGMFGDYTPLKNSIPVTMIALGSYGREQLCVHSDIDLMIVFEEVGGYNHKALIEKILYILWDMGLKLGHRVHDVNELLEVSNTDITIKTALIESRFIEGSRFVWTKVQNSINQIRHHNIGEFITQKMKEQQEKHHQFPLTMEPHLKEGVGGFRDANLVYWIGKILYNTDNIRSIPLSIIDEKEYREFRIALEFLFRVRSALHLVANKKEDRLRLELIPNVARLLGYKNTPQDWMRFSRRVTENLKIIRLYSTIWLELLTRDYCKQPISNYLYPQNDTSNTKSIITLLEMMSEASHTPFVAHPTLLHSLTKVIKPQRVNESIFDIVFKLLYRPHLYSVLQALAYAKKLRYIFYPLLRVIGLPQFDGYHAYAVDIHSMECIKYLESIEDPFVLSLYQSLDEDERAMLKLVTLLHDAGKGRKTDHHLVGASLFSVFAQKIGINPTLITMGETLILYHTTMSKVAQREDIHSAKVILRFASLFKTRKMLDFIYILTYADMSGVGKGIYNSFSAKLIHTLYLNALEILGQDALLDETAKLIKKEQALMRHAGFQTLTKNQQNKILEIPSNHLFLTQSADEIMTIAQKTFHTDHYTFEIHNDTFLRIEIIRKTPINLAYLLVKVSQLEIRQMDIYKLFDNAKYFHIAFAQKVGEEEIQRIEQYIHHSFIDRSSFSLPKPLIKADEIHIDCDHSTEYSTLYLNCANQKGLLAYIVDLFGYKQIDIATAKIHTIKKRAKDMFLIEKKGNFCGNIDIITEQLITKGD